jgi:hypothetical protein
MIKTGLYYVGGFLLLYGLLEVILELVLLFNFYSEWLPADRQFFSQWLFEADSGKAYWADKRGDLGRGITNLATGLIMLGIHRLISNQEEQSKKSEVATLRKDLGNWPPSV